MKQSKFIVIEGLEGAGKSTVIDFIKNIFNESKTDFVAVHEPGSGDFGAKIRSILKDPNSKLLPDTELLLLTANRLEIIEKIIKPALDNDQWVIGDRHFLSTLAYQGGGRGLDKDYIHKIHNLVIKNFKPDLYLYLDLEPKLGLERAKARGELDRFEQEQIDFFERIRKVYLEEVENNKNIELIDASCDLTEVQEQVQKVLFKHYPQLCTTLG